MKRFITLLLAMILCMGCFAPAAMAASSCDAVVTASFLNIRSEAGSQYGVVATAPRGSLLTVIGVATENEDWFKVDYNGTVGYADSRYIINADSSPAAEAIAKENEGLLGAMKEALGDKVTRVAVTTRLSDVPAVVTTEGPISLEGSYKTDNYGAEVKEALDYMRECCAKA